MTVTSDINVTVSCDDEWVKAGFIVGKTDENLKISVEANSGPSERKTVIELAAEGAESIVVEVVQEGLKIVIVNCCRFLSPVKPMAWIRICRSVLIKRQ